MSDRTVITEPVTDGGAGPPTPAAPAPSGRRARPNAAVGGAPAEAPEAPAVTAPRPNGQGGRSPGVHAALSVMELVVSQGRLGLGDLARELQLPKSTLHRICAILVDRGWALRDEQGRYEPGVRAIGLGSRAANLPIVTGFRHAVADLMTRHDETMCLAVIDGDESVFIAIEETTQPVRLQTWVGRRAPAFASASGRVILAGRPATAIAAEYGGRALVTPTGRRLQTIGELAAILARVRADGFAENHEETAAGLYTASVPIVNETGTVLAAMTMCVPTSRMYPGRRAELLADLIAAGEALSRDVAWLPAFNAKRL
jgi:IclR family transcriptional regulator, KDG regulon repressor